MSFVKRHLDILVSVIWGVSFSSLRKRFFFQKILWLLLVLIRGIIFFWFLLAENCVNIYVDNFDPLYSVDSDSLLHTYHNICWFCNNMQVCQLYLTSKLLKYRQETKRKENILGKVLGLLNKIKNLIYVFQFFSIHKNTT